MLEYNGNGLCHPLDSDILSGKRFFRGDPNLAALRKKFNAHQLLISTVWERYLPVAVALGPQADESEDPLVAELARAVLGELGTLMGAKVVRVDQAGLAEAFGTQRGRSLKSVVGEILSAPLGSRNRCLTLAAAAGIYAIATTAPPPADRLLRTGL
jgi:hypothetical protein